MNCIAIDDEPLALDIISEFCTRINYLNLIGTFTNPYDAVQILNTIEIDLIFLDIHMPQINGIEFLKSLYNPPLMIFTTAYKEHAFQGFEYDAVDYLIKPFSSDRFTKSVNKAHQLLKLKTRSESKHDEKPVNTGGFIMVKVEYNTIRVNLDDILYIEGLKDYVKVYIHNSLKPILSLTSLKLLESKLPEDKFMRVHRSFIVNLEKIDTIERSRIVFGKEYIPVSDQYKDKFQEYLDKNFL
jgi:DNA-binding LytR/AlgR family response regulator